MDSKIADETNNSVRIAREPLRIGLLCCLVLIPLWIVTLFHRSLWTPDEPREADITWRMSQQAERAVPSLAGQPFLEKPPLAYWLGAWATSADSQHVAALRAPNLICACLSTLAIALLAFAGGGACAARVAALASATFLLALQVASWLATDAPMLLGVTLALLGFYRGLHAAGRVRKLLWFTLMHVGLTWAFLAKGPGAWLVPLLAALGLLILERNGRALLRWEMWLPIVIPIAVITTWVIEVSRSSHGPQNLAVLLWYNVAGRVVSLDVEAGALYSQAHHNFPGKYLLELPFYLAPWTFLFVGAVRRAWRRRREPDSSLWRYALCGVVLPLIALSLATTARGIYAAPILPCAAILIGLWFATVPDAFDRAMLGATYCLVVVLSFVLFAGAAVSTVAAGGPLQDAAILIIGVGACLIALIIARRWRAQQLWREVFAPLFAAFLIALLASAWILLPHLDRAQDIAARMRDLDRDLGSRSLVLFTPDETTIAVLDMNAPRHRDRWRAVSTDTELDALLRQADAATGVLVLLPGHADGPLDETLRSWGIKVSRPRRAQILDHLTGRLGLAVEKLYEVPEGRRYALLSRLSAQPTTSPARRHEPQTCSKQHRPGEHADSPRLFSARSTSYFSTPSSMAVQTALHPRCD